MAKFKSPLSKNMEYIIAQIHNLMGTVLGLIKEASLVLLLSTQTQNKTASLYLQKIRIFALEIIFMGQTEFSALSKNKKKNVEIENIV